MNNNDKIRAKFPGFEITDSDILRAEGKGTSFKRCECGQTLMEVRDSRKPAYCDKCQRLENLRNKYEHEGSNLTLQERKEILADTKTKRQGPFWNPKKPNA